MPGRNEPCPCGSGKKFKRCCGSKAAGKGPRLLGHPAVWAGAAALLVLLVVVLNWGGAPGAAPGGPGKTFYGESDLPELDFSGLAETAKEDLLSDINARSCTCGCQLTLAQCVATDSTCPLRSSNLEEIRELIRSVPPVG